MDSEERKQRLAREIVARAAMARGLLVLDENVSGIASALSQANIRVVRVPPGLSDDQIKEHFIPNRIIVTRNAEHFVADAPIYDYGVISLDRLSFIDSEPSFKRNQTARLISDAMSRYSLWAKGAKFLLELHDDGNHVLRELS